MLDEVPSGWMAGLLSDRLQIDWGDTSVTKKRYVEDGFNAFSAAGQDGQLDYFDYECDGIVVSAIGANSGRCFWADGQWTAIKNTMVVFPKDDADIDLRFVFYYVTQRGFWPLSGGAQPFIGLTNARKASFNFPPLAEQQRIAEILTSVDDAIRATEAVIAQTERVKLGVMEDLLTGGLGSEAIANGEVPDGWKVKK